MLSSNIAELFKTGDATASRVTETGSYLLGIKAGGPSPAQKDLVGELTLLVCKNSFDRAAFQKGHAAIRGYGYDWDADELGLAKAQKDAPTTDHRSHEFW